MRFQILTLLGLAVAAACSPGATSLSTSTADSTLVSSSGTLSCTPGQAQIDACSGKAAGDSCTLAIGDGGVTDSGTCRATLDGKTVACVPNPPPQPAVDACTGKASGDTCTVTERDGDTDTGTCATPPGQSVLACIRVHTPPQAAIDACSGKASGDACTLPDRHNDGGTIAGVCGKGPTGTGTLACEPAHRLPQPIIDACNGKAAGDACTVTERNGTTSGTCAVDSSLGATICVVACEAFRAGGGCGGPGGGGPHGGPGHH